MVTRDRAALRSKSGGEAPAQRDATLSPDGAAKWAAEDESGKEARAPADQGSGGDGLSQEPHSLVQPPIPTYECGFEGGNCCQDIVAKAPLGPGTSFAERGEALLFPPSGQQVSEEPGPYPSCNGYERGAQHIKRWTGAPSPPSGTADAMSPGRQGASVPSSTGPLRAEACLFGDRAPPGSSLFLQSPQDGSGTNVKGGTHSHQNVTDPLQKIILHPDNRN